MAVVVPGMAQGGLQPATLPDVRKDAQQKREAAEQWKEVLKSVAETLEKTQASGRIVVASTCY